MPTQTYRFSRPDQLKDLLNWLIDEMAARLVWFRVSKNSITAEFDKEVELEGYGDEELWEHLRTSYITSYEYMGGFSFGVIKDIFRRLKNEGLVPAYLLIHPSSTLKSTVEWLDMSIPTLSGTQFLGMSVVEEPAIDEDGFVIAAGHSPEASVHNIVLGVKGQVQ